MKTKDTLIAVLTIGIVVLGVLYYKECKKNSSSVRTRDKVKCFSIEDLQNTSNDAIGLGFSEEDVPYIRKIIEARKSLFNPVNGYQIDLKCVDSLYEAIKLHNDTTKIDSLKIRGLRIYEAKSSRQIHGTEQYVQDLVMIPYLNNNKDIYLVDLGFLVRDTKMIFSHFRPCPKLCSKTEQYYIYQK